MNDKEKWFLQPAQKPIIEGDQDSTLEEGAPEQLLLFSDLPPETEAEALERARLEGAPEDVPAAHRVTHSWEIKLRALELFNQGYGYKRASLALGLPAYTVRDWNRLYKENKFPPKVDDEDEGDLFEKKSES